MIWLCGCLVSVFCVLLIYFYDSFHAWAVPIQMLFLYLCVSTMVVVRTAVYAFVPRWLRFTFRQGMIVYTLRKIFCHSAVPHFVVESRTSEASGGNQVVLYATVYTSYFDFVFYQFLPRLCADLYYYNA